MQIYIPSLPVYHSIPPFHDHLTSFLKATVVGTLVVHSLICVQLLATPWTAVTRLPCPPLCPGICSHSCPLSQWCYPTTLSSVTPSPPALNLSQHQGLFKCQLFTSGGQSIGASASASVLPMNIQDWFPLGWTGWISTLSKELSRVFSSTAVWKHQLFHAQPPSGSSCHISIWPLGKP